MTNSTSSTVGEGKEILDATISGRYRVEHRLGGGGQADTFLAEDQQAGRRVCLKQVIVDEIDDWKSVELFERESATLERLDHPAIPRFVDAFHEPADDDGAERFVLVQEYVDGADLEQLLEEGNQFTEADLRELADQLLEILVYLHDHNPPVIHRDIKPSNVMRRDEDGRFVLVDFGTVRVAAVGPSHEVTTVGTTGYTPHEQFAGHVEPASDQYALGATLIHLAARTHPGELPVRSMTIDFRDRVQLSDPFTDFIERLVEPKPEDRFSSAADALEALRGAGEQRESTNPDDDLSTTPFHQVADYSREWTFSHGFAMLDRGKFTLEKVDDTVQIAYHAGTSFVSLLTGLTFTVFAAIFIGLNFGAHISTQLGCILFSLSIVFVPVLINVVGKIFAGDALYLSPEGIVSKRWGSTPIPLNRIESVGHKDGQLVIRANYQEQEHQIKVGPGRWKSATLSDTDFRELMAELHRFLPAETRWVF